MDTPHEGVQPSLLDSESAKAFAEYLELMEDTEAPRHFITWTLIAAAAALIGRNSTFRRGPLFNMPANLFVVLLGPAAIRKSTPINQIAEILRDFSVNFGPTDTGGQRHGLMSSLVGHHRFVPERPKEKPLLIHGAHPFTLSPRAPADVFLAAPELGRLMGTGSREMADFFVDLYDGAKIDYQTKASETVIHKTLVNMLGATTPASLASILSEGAAGHGILTRIIFVWGDEKHKDVPIPPIPDDIWYEKREDFKTRLEWIDQNRLPFEFESGADKLYEKLYSYQAKIEDNRMEEYKGRRSTHLMKVSMCIAALRCSHSISESDINMAHALLQEIEPNMHKALEYFGKNKAFVGRMLIVNFLKNQPDYSATRGELIHAAMSELNKREAEEAIESMLGAKELTELSGKFVLRSSVKAELKGMAQRR